MPVPADLTLAYAAYLIGTASPGPSVLAVMGTAMAHGRARALALAAGVVAGSQTWGLCAAFGMAAALRRYSDALVLVKMLGGAYLLWLAWQAARKAWRPRGAMTKAPEADGEAATPSPPAGPSPAPTCVPTIARTFARGLALHLTNPKAIFVWLSFVSLALPPGARQADALAVVARCGAISATVFAAYALAFSTAVAGRGYRAAERPINALLAGAFGLAGLRLLLSGQSR